MHAYEIFKDLAIIIISAKLIGLLARKCKVPQVVGEILAGLLIGPSVLGFVAHTEYLSYFAEIGVVLIMFSAGLETDLREMIKTGPLALAIAVFGVFVPLVFGTILYTAFYGFDGIGTLQFYKAIFIGVVLTATSVGITVKALAELGKLKSELGTTIVSAAIIDDIIGILVLTIVVGIGGNSVGGASEIIAVVVKTLLFFVFAIVVGLIFYKLFKWLDRGKHVHTQRIPIFGLGLCFALAYCAEKYFGVADVTGAYLAGLILCNIQDAEYIDRKMSISSYMMFGPVFFAGIGLKTDISGITPMILAFSVCFVIVALLSKILGCGAISKICRHSNTDSLIIGVGMMTRGEVALIVAQKGLSVGLLEPIYFTPVIILIIISSILTPIILKFLFNKKEREALETK